MTAFEVSGYRSAAWGVWLDCWDCWDIARLGEGPVIVAMP